MWTDGRTEWTDGRKDGRTHGRRQNYVPPTSGLCDDLMTFEYLRGVGNMYLSFVYRKPLHSILREVNIVARVL